MRGSDYGSDYTDCKSSFWMSYVRLVAIHIHMIKIK